MECNIITEVEIKEEQNSDEDEVILATRKYDEIIPSPNKICNVAVYINETQCILGCSTDENSSFVEFPKQKHRLTQWCKLLQMKIPELENRKQLPILCSKHFKNQDWIYGTRGNIFLKPDAVPRKNVSAIQNVSELIATEYNLECNSVEDLQKNVKVLTNINNAYRQNFILSDKEVKKLQVKLQNTNAQLANCNRQLTSMKKLYDASQNENYALKNKQFNQQLHRSFTNKTVNNIGKSALNEENSAALSVNNSLFDMEPNESNKLSVENKKLSNEVKQLRHKCESILEKNIVGLKLKEQESLFCDLLRSHFTNFNNLKREHRNLIRRKESVEDSISNYAEVNLNKFQATLIKLQLSTAKSNTDFNNLPSYFKELCHFILSSSKEGYDALVKAFGFPPVTFVRSWTENHIENTADCLQNYVEPLHNDDRSLTLSASDLSGDEDFDSASDCEGAADENEILLGHDTMAFVEDGALKPYQNIPADVLYKEALDTPQTVNIIVSEPEAMGSMPML